MKRILTLFCLCLLVFATSCVKSNGSTSAPNITALQSIAVAAWTSADQGKTWTANVPVSALDGTYYSSGGVLLYLQFSGSAGNAPYQQLPWVYGGLSYSFSYYTGNVTVYLQASDGKTVVAAPTSTVLAKVVLIPSN